MKKVKIAIFADGADIKSIKKLDKLSFVKGFTTNPSLMRKSGIKNYLDFARRVSKIIKKKPISLEVFSDNIQEMEKDLSEHLFQHTTITDDEPMKYSDSECACVLCNNLNTDLTLSSIKVQSLT